MVKKCISLPRLLKVFYTQSPSRLVSRVLWCVQVSTPMGLFSRSDYMPVSGMGSKLERTSSEGEEESTAGLLNHSPQRWRRVPTNRQWVKPILVVSLVSLCSLASFFFGTRWPNVSQSSLETCSVYCMSLLLPRVIDD